MTTSLLLLVLLGAEFSPVETIDGVEVSQRAVAGSAYVELRFRMEAPGDAEAACTRVWGTGALERGEPHVVSRKVLEQTADTRLTLEQIAPPLISRRDYVLLRERHHLPGGGCRIDFHTVDDARAPPREDVLRLGRLSGSTELLPAGEGRVRVEQRVHLEPGGSLIPWMVEPSRRKEGARYLKHLMALPPQAAR